MMLHERRAKPMRLWPFLCGLCMACEVHDSVWNQDKIAVTQGSAVAAWLDAQVLSRDVDSGAVRLQPDAAAHDAAVSDAALVDASDELDAGAGDAPDAMADAATEPFDPLKPCTFDVTTLSQGGRYAPKNIGAIWIARADGSWVKTLELWASVRLRYLEAYRAANTTGNKVDAVTSPTLRMPKTHSVTWNLKDAQGKDVPDGDYQVQVEVTDDDKRGKMLSLPFKKTSAKFQASAMNNDFFHDVQLRCR